MKAISSLWGNGFFVICLNYDFCDLCDNYDLLMDIELLLMIDGVTI